MGVHLVGLLLGGLEDQVGKEQCGQMGERLTASVWPPDSVGSCKAATVGSRMGGLCCA